jgi:type II secretory pathway pseudopilin PulG
VKQTGIPHRQRHRRRRRAGWIMLDMITGLIILLVLIATFSAALLRQQRGQQKLADTRAAMRLAEETASLLQLGQAPPAPPEGESIEVVPLSSPDQTPPAGHAWVRIRVTNNGRTATLVALARSSPTTQPGASK